ncbi:MAG: RidA family protein [Polaribacter sp.]|jgi:enamine deaminase RidA (YjgF/YER057c/UK114 family)|uniref:RidA family protein n=1 Tax=Polaribacter sp. TaxID=1920175 RepID=UPI00260F2F6D|nr:RidA family protein [uncultured Polaribacter sp.]
MSRKLISSGSSFEKEMGYSRAVVEGDWVFVSGTTGFNYDTMTIEEDVVAQTEQCFKNIKNILEEANSSLDKIVRITYILPKPSDFESCWPVLKKYLENIRPAATMFSADLFDKKMKIEIQVTALNK